MKVLFPCDQNLAESQFSATCTRQLKEDNEKIKQNAERYEVREGSGSLVGVQWAVRWVAVVRIYGGKDL